MVEAWDKDAAYKLVHSDDADLFASEMTDAHRQGFRIFGEHPVVVCPVRDGGLAHWHVLMVRYGPKENR